MFTLLQRKKSLLQELLHYSQQALFEFSDISTITKQRSKILDQLEQIDKQIETQGSQNTKQEEAYIQSFKSLLLSIEENNKIFLETVEEEKEELDLERKGWQNTIKSLPNNVPSQKQVKPVVARQHVIDQYKT